MMNSLKRSVQTSVARHGLAVMLVGLIGGFAWAFALLGEVKLSPIPFTLFDEFPGDPARWRVVHTGCILNGIMAMVMASVLGFFSTTPEQNRLVRLGILLAIWGNTVFYICSVFAPNRSLSIGDNALGAGNIAGTIGYLVAMVAAIGLILVVVTLLRAAIAAKEEPNA